MKQNTQEREFWFVVGTQFLYGEEVLDTIAARAAEMAQIMSRTLPFPLEYKGLVKTWDDAVSVMKKANYDDGCLGVVAWCHTFSPAKMWLEGLRILQKPFCHFATQYNRSIPNDEIDMDFMNLNQAAHGDREFGFAGARLRMARKIVMGYWQDEQPLAELEEWMRAAYGYKVSRELRVMRFGDNMREVAVTEGDKVEAQLQFGWQVNTWPVGDLAAEMDAVPDADIDNKVEEYARRYEMAAGDTDAIRYQAREEIAMRRMFERENIGAFSNTFQDLHGMRQLPGLASQNLMADGYGYGGEGDWKVSAMTRVMKAMTEGMGGGTAFMEDYTYNLEKGKEYSLGAHMLEVCPSLAAQKPRIEVHPLGIGDREAPARLVFEGRAGKAIVVSLVDMGGRFRMIIQDIECVKPIFDMPNLPVARVMWRARPDLCTGAKLWIMAGGAHHSVLSYDATPGMMIDWAEMNDIEVLHITAQTTVEGFRQQLQFSDIVWGLKCLKS